MNPVALDLPISGQQQLIASGSRNNRAQRYSVLPFQMSNPGTHTHGPGPIRVCGQLMRHFLVSRPLFLSMSVLAVGLFPLADVRGQIPEDGLVYKFVVDGISDRPSAKPLQLALMEQASVTGCVFIDECDCFKLSTDAPIRYGMLAEVLSAAGHALVGEVLVSDGTVLRPGETNPFPR